jgi:hypothetical protein
VRIDDILVSPDPSHACCKWAVGSGGWPLLVEEMDGFFVDKFLLPVAACLAVPQAVFRPQL